MTSTTEAGKRGGEARRKALTQTQLSDIARKAALARWHKSSPPDPRLVPTTNFVLQIKPSLGISEVRNRALKILKILDQV